MLQSSKLLSVFKPDTLSGVLTLFNDHNLSYSQTGSVLFLQLVYSDVELCTRVASFAMSLNCVLHTLPVIDISKGIIRSSTTIVSLFIVGQHKHVFM